jgi:hypothetical protein
MPTDPTMPAPALTEDASVTPPEQPPMLDDDGDDTVNGEEAGDVPDRDLFA